MEPYNQAPQNNQYDFITNPTQPTRQPGFGGSMKSRIIVVVVILIFLMILAGVVSTLLTAGSKKATQQLKDVVAEQQEIIRVSQLGMNDALSSETRGYSATVNLVTQTSQKEMLERLNIQKIKLNKLEQAAKLNPKTEELLKSAGSNNRYDEAMTETLNDLLNKHKKTLQTAYNSAESPKTKEVLEKNFKSVNILAPPQNTTDSQ